jgi:hypothetical protein
VAKKIAVKNLSHLVAKKIPEQILPQLCGKTYFKIEFAT